MPPIVTPEHDSGSNTSTFQQPISAASVPRRSQRVADHQINGENAPIYNQKVHPSYDSALKPAFFARQTGQTRPSPNVYRSSVSSVDSTDSVCSLESTNSSEGTPEAMELIDATPLERSPNPAATRRSSRPAASKFHDYNTKRHPADKSLGIRSGKRHVPATSASASSLSSTKSPTHGGRQSKLSPRDIYSVEGIPDPLDADAALEFGKNTTKRHREEHEIPDAPVGKRHHMSTNMPAVSVFHDSRRAGFARIVDNTDDEADIDIDNNDEHVDIHGIDQGGYSPSGDLDAISLDLAESINASHEPYQLSKKRYTRSFDDENDLPLDGNNLMARPEGARRAFQDATLAPNMNLAGERFGRHGNPASRQSSATSYSPAAPLLLDQQHVTLNTQSTPSMQQELLTTSLDDPVAAMKAIEQMIASGTLTPAMVAQISKQFESSADSFAVPPGRGLVHEGTPQSTADSNMDAASPVDGAIFALASVSQESPRHPASAPEPIEAPHDETQSLQRQLSQQQQHSRNLARRRRRSTKHKLHGTLWPRSSTGRPSTLGLRPASSEPENSPPASRDGLLMSRSPAQSRTQNTLRRSDVR